MLNGIAQAVGRRRPGYTAVELLIVFMIGAILMGMVVSGASGYVSRKGSANARDAFVYLALRARAAAIERGRNVSIRVSAMENRAVLAEGCPPGSHVLEEYSFGSEYSVHVVFSASDPIVICYTPRGFALGNETTIKNKVRVGFMRGADTAYASIAPLGQVEVVR